MTRNYGKLINELSKKTVANGCTISEEISARKMIQEYRRRIEKVTPAYRKIGNFVVRGITK